MKPLTNEVLLSLQNEIEEKRKKIEDTVICREDEGKAVNRQRKFFNVLEDCIAEWIITNPSPEDIERQLESQMPNMKTVSQIWFTVPTKYGQMPILPNQVTQSHFRSFVDRMIEEYHGDTLRKMFPTAFRAVVNIAFHNEISYSIHHGITVYLPYPQPDLL